MFLLLLLLLFVVLGDIQAFGKNNDVSIDFDILVIADSLIVATRVATSDEMPKNGILLFKHLE